jgi:hypothetical protein
MKEGVFVSAAAAAAAKSLITGLPVSALIRGPGPVCLPAVAEIGKKIRVLLMTIKIRE